LRSAGFDVRFFLPIGGVGTKCQDETASQNSLIRRLQRKWPLRCTARGSPNRGWDEQEGEWRRMRVDTERGKALERLSGSRCAADGNQLYPSRPLAVGLMIRS